jgi:hypothetical protein
MASSVGGTVRSSALAVFDIDHQFELGGLHHRQLGRLGTLENPTDVDADLPTPFRGIGAVAHQTTSFNKTAVEIGRRNPMASRERGNLDPSAAKERNGPNKKGICLVMHKPSECRFDLASGTGCERHDL